MEPKDERERERDHLERRQNWYGENLQILMMFVLRLYINSNQLKHETTPQFTPVAMLEPSFKVRL